MKKKRIKIFNPLINKKHCFECLAPAKEMHHIVPVALGGTRVIPLCEKCHGKVHSLEREGHSLLIKVALQNKIRDGYLTGNAPYGFKVDNNGKTLIEEAKEQSVINVILSLRKREYTIRAVYQELIRRKITSRAGNPLTLAAIHRIIVRNTKSIK